MAVDVRTIANCGNQIRKIDAGSATKIKYTEWFICLRFGRQQRRN